MYHRESNEMYSVKRMSVVIFLFCFFFAFVFFSFQVFIDLRHKLLCSFSVLNISYDINKDHADLGGRYPPGPLASTVDNTPLDLYNSSYQAQPH